MQLFLHLFPLHLRVQIYSYTLAKVKVSPQWQNSIFFFHHCTKIGLLQLQLLASVRFNSFFSDFFLFGSLKLLPSSFLLSSATSSFSRPRRLSTSATGKNGAGRDHSDSFATITVLLRTAAAAAAPPGYLRLTRPGGRCRHWRGQLGCEAHIDRWFLKRFNNVLRAQETSSPADLRPSLCSSSFSCWCRCFPSFAFRCGWSWTFFLTVFAVLAVLPVFSLHAGNSSSEPLATDCLLLLLLHPKECVNPQLGL